MDEAEAQIRVTAVDRREAPQIAALWGESGQLHGALDGRFALSERAPSFYKALVLKALADANCRIRAARLPGSEEIVGFHLSQITPVQPVFRHGRTGYITDLVVASRARRRGIATLLARDAIEWFRCHDISAVQIHVLCTNEPAQAFWRGLGFRPYMDRLWLDIESEPRGGFDGREC
jgi:ribosomal protein S18 acetylase RimI-like enzyme